MIYDAATYEFNRRNYVVGADNSVYVQDILSKHMGIPIKKFKYQIVEVDIDFYHKTMNMITYIDKLTVLKNLYASLSTLEELIASNISNDSLVTSGVEQLAYIRTFLDNMYGDKS